MKDLILWCWGSKILVFGDGFLIDCSFWSCDDFCSLLSDYVRLVWFNWVEMMCICFDFASRMKEVLVTLVFLGGFN